MGIFQQFPYSNFHEFNLDQIIKIMREMQDEWENTKTEWASYKDFIDNYFANLDLDEETEKALRALVADGTLSGVIDPVIINETIAWLADHITQPTTPAIDNSLRIAGAAADAKATGDALDQIRTFTDNLWLFGDSGEFTRHQLYSGFNLPAGVYTVGAYIESNDIDSNYCAMVFNYTDNTTKFVNLRRNYWNFATVTLDQDVNKIDLYASNNWSHTAGDQASWSDIVIYRGAAVEPVSYVPAVSADDYMLREVFGASTDSTIIASGFYRDNISDHNGVYVLLKSEDGVNFSVLNIQLPSNTVAFDASAIIEINGYFVFAVKGDISGVYSIQFFATKDFKTWIESNVAFPGDFQGIANSAIAFFMDGGNPYISWSAEYQEIPGDPTWYHLPHYMPLTFTDGVFTTDGTYADIDIGDALNNDSYIDPFVIKAEGAYYVAVKNEITKRIELYKGLSLSALTLIMNPVGTLVEAPSIIFNEKTRTMTLYASAHSLDTVVNDVMLFISFRLFGSSSDIHDYGETIWSLAEYRSLYRIRHPYCAIVSQKAVEQLKGFKTVPAPLYPITRTVLCEQRDDGIFYMPGDYVLDQFVAHSRVRFIITSTTASEHNTPMSLLPILNQPCQLVVKPGNNIISFDFDGAAWGDYDNKHFSITGSDVPMFITFNPDGESEWAAEYAVAKDLIS